MSAPHLPIVDPAYIRNAAEALVAELDRFGSKHWDASDRARVREKIIASLTKLQHTLSNDKANGHPVRKSWWRR